MGVSWCTILTLLAILTVCTAHKSFQAKIPNGDKVPNPCDNQTIWAGVGHWNKAGGDARNLFGLAFKAAGFKWTTALCQADTDGDGRTNGMELGDPKCTWTLGATPSTSSGLSHPGVCEPPASEKCKKLNTVDVCNLNSSPSVTYSFAGILWAALTVMYFSR